MLALTFALFLFAQAGVPLTSGFFAKFYVITAAVEAGSTWLAIIAMLTAVVAAFLYLRIIVSMYMSVEDAGEPRTIRVPVRGRPGPGHLRGRHPGRRPVPGRPVQHRQGRDARAGPRARRRGRPELTAP